MTLAPCTPTPAPCASDRLTPPPAPHTPRTTPSTTDEPVPGDTRLDAAATYLLHGAADLLTAFDHLHLDADLLTSGAAVTADLHQLPTQATAALLHRATQRLTTTAPPHTPSPGTPNPAIGSHLGAIRAQPRAEQIRLLRHAATHANR